MIYPKISLSVVQHREQLVIKIDFRFNKEILSALRSLPVKWSRTLQSWYIVYSEKNMHDVRKIEQEFSSVVNKHEDHHFVTELKLAENKTASRTGILPALSDKHTASATALESWMRARRYSESTISTYKDALVIFLRYFGDKEPTEINNGDLIHFNNAYILKNKLSSSYQNQVVNAVKLYFRTIENKKLEPELIHRPKRAKVLPNVLSKEEVKLLLTVQTNIKHKLMLSLIYSCGLRRGELLNLKISDIEFNRGLIIVRQSKGRKDRIVPLSEKISVMIKDYLIGYKPKAWLFEGQNNNGAYDERSLANVLKQAVEKSGIKKPITLHWLRHSYATHLLENGTDLRYIQEILGHSRSTTTEIYTHVSNKSIQRVISPFDSL